MRRLGALFAAAMFAGAAPGLAEGLDLSTLSCKDFLAGNKDDSAAIVAWLHGYYRDKDEPPVIDFARIKSDADKIAEYCTQNPTHALITATDKVLGEDAD
jgi:acid stress chaperone HdeB